MIFGPLTPGQTHGIQSLPSLVLQEEKLWDSQWEEEVILGPVKETVELSMIFGSTIRPPTHGPKRLIFRELQDLEHAEQELFLSLHYVRRRQYTDL